MTKKLKLHKVLQHLIDKRGITLRDLSRKTKIPASTLSSLMSGAQIQKVEHALTLSEFFGVSLEYLLFGKTKKSLTVEEMKMEHVFSGWLRVHVERAIPDETEVNFEDED